MATKFGKPTKFEGNAAEVLTKAQLAGRLGKTDRTIDEWVKRGYIPRIKVGRSSLFCWEDVVVRLKEKSE